METEHSLSLGDQRWTLPDGSDTVTIGRASNADIRLTADDQISRIHARLNHTGATWTLVDESRNGTALNGRRLAAPTRLTEGDQIQIGRSVLTFHEPAVTPSAPAASLPPETDTPTAAYPPPTDAPPAAYPPADAPPPAYPPPAAAPAAAYRASEDDPADSYAAPSDAADGYAPSASQSGAASSTPGDVARPTPFPENDPQANLRAPGNDPASGPFAPTERADGPDHFSLGEPVALGDPAASPYAPVGRPPTTPPTGPTNQPPTPPADSPQFPPADPAQHPRQPAPTDRGPVAPEDSGQGRSPFAPAEPDQAGPIPPVGQDRDPRQFVQDDRDASPFAPDEYDRGADGFTPGQPDGAPGSFAPSDAERDPSPFAPVDRDAGAFAPGDGEQAASPLVPGGDREDSPFAGDAYDGAYEQVIGADEFVGEGYVEGHGDGAAVGPGDWGAYPSADNPEPARSPWAGGRTVPVQLDRSQLGRYDLPGPPETAQTEHEAPGTAQAPRAGESPRTAQTRPRRPAAEAKPDEVGQVRLGRVLAVAGALLALGLLINLGVTFMADGPGGALRWLVPPAIALITAMVVALMDAASSQPRPSGRLTVSAIVAIVVVLVGVGVGGFALTAGVEYAAGYLTGKESGEDRLVKPVGKTVDNLAVTVENVTYTSHFTRVQLLVKNTGDQSVTVPLDGNATFTGPEGNAIRADDFRSQWPGKFPSGGTEHGTITFKGHLPGNLSTATLTLKSGDTTVAVGSIALSN